MLHERHANRFGVCLKNCPVLALVHTRSSMDPTACAIDKEDLLADDGLDSFPLPVTGTVCSLQDLETPDTMRFDASFVNDPLCHVLS